MNKNAWLLRPNPDNKSRITEFVEKNIIAIGWPGFGDLSKKNREQIKELLQNHGNSGTVLGSATATIDIFVNRMQIGDLVLIPAGDDIYLGEIEGNYEFDLSKDTEDEGYPHQRKIIMLRKMFRSELPYDIRLSLKVQRTAADLTKYYEEIKLLSEGADIADLPQKSLNEKKEFLNIEYPIRPGVIVKLSVPEDITQQEASRLSEFVKTVYFK